MTLGGIGIIGLFVFAGFALSASSHVDSRDNQFLFPGLFVLTAFIGIFIIASFILLVSISVFFNFSDLVFIFLFRLLL